MKTIIETPDPGEFTVYANRGRDGIYVSCPRCGVLVCRFHLSSVELILRNISDHRCGA